MQDESPSDDTPLVHTCPHGRELPNGRLCGHAIAPSASLYIRIIVGGLFLSSLLLSSLRILHQANDRRTGSTALAPITEVSAKDDAERIEVGLSISAKRTWSSFGRNTACRLDSKDSTTDGLGSVQVSTTADLAACKALCQTHHICTGIEFAHENERCEIWTEHVGFTEPADGFECFSYTEHDSNLHDAERHEKSVSKSQDAERHAKSICKIPARTQAAPSIFCWTVMMPDSAEQALVASQLKGVAGIFACNDYAVISRKKVQLGKDECGDDVSTWLVDMPAKMEKGKGGPNGLTSSWLNAGVFQDAWGSLMSSDTVWQYKFIVKADPDSVLFPDRLRTSLQTQQGMVYFTNCRFWSGDMVGKLYGSLEVVSRDALTLYHKHKSTCWNLPWHLWGEDLWLQKCMEALKVPVDTRLISKVDDDYCSSEHWGQPGACTGWDKVSFHPHKDTGSWWSCWKQAGR